jgi:hypothetical protein
MPCLSTNPCPDGPPLMVDYHRQHPHSPTKVYRPTNKAELVWAIQDAEAHGWQARPVGTDMALSRAGYTDDAAILTAGLNRHVLLPFGPTADPTDTTRFANGNLGLVACMAPEVQARNPNLVFVEGGTKIRELLDDLMKLTPPMALPAMGAGSRQAVVGALATGTHGSENDRQPLIDAIRAIWLVGPGGQEWWLERSNGWSVEAQLNATNIPGWCNDTIVRYDDELFYAALVGVGRLGVIYALVLEVEPDYWLLERRTPQGESWSAVLAELTTSITSGYSSPSGIFTTRGVMFFQIALNPNDLTTCWTVQRRRIAPSTESGMTKDPFDALILFCKPCAPLWPAIGPAIELFARPILNAMAATPLLFPDPIIGTIGALSAIAWVNNTLNWIQGVFLTSSNIGEALLTVVRQIPALMVPLTNELMKMGHSIPGPQPGPRHFKRGPAAKVLDQVDYTAPTDCFFGTGSEYFFNARSSGYLTFVSQAATLAVSLGGIPGYISLRFIPQTDAYLGMERWPLTVAIELSSVTPWPTADAYLMGAQGLAIAAGGIPHWGQKLYEPIPTTTLYNSALNAYHVAVATVQDGRASTFSSPFSTAQAIDPPPLPLPAVTAAARRPVSVKAVLTAGASLVPSALPPTSVRAVAAEYKPSLRMNPNAVPLPVGRAAIAQRGVSLRDLSRRLI